MTDLIDTTEMYLRTIYELQEEGITPLRARIAERLDHSGPTVSQTIARMERDGLVKVAGDRHLELTDTGLDTASKVMRKHRLAERLLSDVIGLDWPYVHEEACRWEHVMSDQVERRLVDLLNQPVYSPFGNPIPGLGEIGGPDTAEGPTRYEGEHLTVALTTPGTFRILLLTEAIQTDPELLAQLAAAGIRPGAVIKASPSDGYVAVRTIEPGPAVALDDSREDFSDEGLEISEETAHHIRVVRS
ncbi:MULTISPECIES: metal-dependent transcriptional regulator [Citricoccus]|uniref:Iron dependent repressor, metal binding and dimerization domain protein n=1 Tax=Citricoccus muralis TaxID=169134 RepID=A0ABY8H7Z2_9MICC|nr:MULTISPECIES: metal-dependent transcriptional regulator [Citricoccus]WBL19106.1 dihydrofolate reductase [Citricoccus sp. NR2]WFP17272.1 iron dependent repressor, metal binding and dimerization domain protein [Citricoccus muralis]